MADRSRVSARSPSPTIRPGRHHGSHACDLSGNRAWALRLRRCLVPVTRVGVQARLAATDIRARLHVI